MAKWSLWLPIKYCFNLRFNKKELLLTCKLKKSCGIQNITLPTLTKNTSVILCLRIWRLWLYLHCIICQESYEEGSNNCPMNADTAMKHKLSRYLENDPGTWCTFYKGLIWLKLCGVPVVQLSLTVKYDNFRWGARAWGRAEISATLPSTGQSKYRWNQEWICNSAV